MLAIFLPFLLAASKPGGGGGGGGGNTGATSNGLSGTIEAPGEGISSGLPRLISNIITLAIAAAGILMLFNFLLAGYDYLTASGDPKKVQNAWAKIWQSIIGILLIIAALALVTVIGNVFGITNILQPTIEGPGGEL